MKFFYSLLKLNRSIHNSQIKLLAIFLARRLRIRHLSLRIDPAIACNLKCKMCPVPHERRTTPCRFNDNEYSRIGAMFFKKALQVVIGCSYEPTMDRRFIQFVKMAKDFRVPFSGLTTNGQLLNRHCIEKCIHYCLSEITLSIHGVVRKTYEKMMVNADYDRLHHLLGELDRCKAKYGVDYPRLRINFTINAANLDEIPLFFEFFGRYRMCTLQLRPMFGDNYPSARLTRSDTERYARYLKVIARQCADRKITLMAHFHDLGFKQDNHAAIIYPEVFYPINPLIVWRSDFNWRNETHEAFCKSIGYDYYLLKSIVSGTNKLIKRAGQFPGSGRFDIL
jgi:MoaA/NifB/PqqE/SkfB family radical SAM enzyme